MLTVSIEEAKRILFSFPKRKVDKGTQTKLWRKRKWISFVIPLEKREKVIEFHKLNYPPGEISKLLTITRGSVKNIVKKYEETGRIKPEK